MKTEHLKNALVVTGVILVVACNSVLDIPEGHLADNGTSGTTSGTTSGNGDDDDTTTTCPNGQKSCAGKCVANDNPQTGCGGTSCDPCNATNGTAACQDGKCIVATCNDGFLDCNDDPSDLCEKDITSDPANCGFCKFKCLGTMRCEDQVCKCNGPNHQECGGPGWTCHDGSGRCACGGTDCDIGEGCNDNNDCTGPQDNQQ